MKIALDKFKYSIRHNKKILVFLVVLGIIALAVGSVFNIMLNNNDKTLVSSYITNFFDSINNNTLDSTMALKNGFISNISYIMIILIIGISVIGIPIILFMYFSKLFILGFSISSIISNYGFKGCLLAFGYIFPHEVINVVLFTMLTLYTIKISGKIVFSVIKRKKIDFKILMNRYIPILLLSLIIGIASTLFEVFITPKIIKLILPLIG